MSSYGYRSPRKSFYSTSKRPKTTKSIFRFGKSALKRIVPLYSNRVIPMLFLALASGLLYFVFSSTFFVVSEIETVGASTFVSDVDLRNLTEEQVFGNYIFSINTFDLEETLTKTFQGAQSIRVSKIYPRRIKVEVIERTPIAILKNERSSDYYMVDGEGYILGLASDEYLYLPKILYEGELHVGLFVDKSLVPLYSQLINSIEEHNLKVSTISVNSRYIYFFLESAIDVFISTKDNVSQSVEIVSDLFKQLSLEGKDVTKIDLRYDKVIVEYDTK